MYLFQNREVSQKLINKPTCFFAALIELIICAFSIGPHFFSALISTALLVRQMEYYSS